MQQLGPLEWARTGQAVMEHNALIGQAFIAMPKFLKLYESGSDGWHAAIHGHSSGRTFPLTEIERLELKGLQIFTVSQLFEVQDNAQISNQDNDELFERLQQLSRTMTDKLRWLTRNIRDLRLPRYAVYPSPLTTAQAFAQQEKKLSTIFRKKSRDKLDKEIGTAPARATRERDGVYFP